jgi:hypothetical protein
MDAGCRHPGYSNARAYFDSTHNMSIKSSALFGTWIDEKSEKPPKLECFGEFSYSERVLITDGRSQWVGYWQSWDDEDDEECMSCWKMVGPDGYEITGVTHWMPLPPLPNNCTGMTNSRKDCESNEDAARASD